MAANQPDPVTYAGVLSQYKPKVARAQSLEEASKHAAGFLSEVDGWLDEEVEQAFYKEVEYLWSTFPPRAKELECYRELVQILLAQVVDFTWYGAYPKYRSDQDVHGDETLYSFRRYDEDFEVRFEYVQYYGHIFMRLPNSLRLRYRRVVNHPGRYTQGLTLTRCKKAMAGLINQISEIVASEVNSIRPYKVLVNSMLRTTAYQETLARMGYVAPRNSAHLAGYAADVEKLWYQRHNKEMHEAIGKTLGDLFERGRINLIEEKTHWHICLNPEHIPTYETLAQKWEGKRR